MADSTLPGYLWAEVLEATNILRNMTPVTNIACTPFEKWSGQKPDLSKLRVIGSNAFCQIPKQFRDGKFMPMSNEGVLVNYCMQSPAYRIWNLSCQKIYDIAAPAYNEEVNPGWWRRPTASVQEVEEELEFPEIPCK